MIIDVKKNKLFKHLHHQFNNHCDVYIINGREYIYDSVREKFVISFPEEKVRQELVNKLIYQIGVPKNLICVEESLRHYNINSRRSSDIIIDAIDEEDGIRYPLAVIECKAPNVPLGYKEHDQLFYYAKVLNCQYAMITNSVDYDCYYHDGTEYVLIKSLPKYLDMLKGECEILDNDDCFQRLGFDEIDEYYYDYIDEIVGSNTNIPLSKAMVNFYECLMDTDYKMECKQYKTFELKRDFGIRKLTCGNSSGGLFYGQYRAFFVEYEGETKMVSLNVSTYSTYNNPDVIKTVINVAIDTKNGSHHALQLNIDDNVVCSGNKLKFYHHGKMAIGRIGSGRISELREFVDNERSDLIYNNKFYLGSLTYDRLWTLEDKEVETIVENLIAYALIRDKYRDYKKSIA